MEVGLSSTAPEAAQNSERRPGQKREINEKEKIIPSSEFFLKEILSLSYVCLLRFGFLGKEQD